MTILEVFLESGFHQSIGREYLDRLRDMIGCSNLVEVKCKSSETCEPRDEEWLNEHIQDIGNKFNVDLRKGTNCPRRNQAWNHYLVAKLLADVGRSMFGPDRIRITTDRRKGSEKIRQCRLRIQEESE
jgi:hypothetical protein